MPLGRPRRERLSGRPRKGGLPERMRPKNGGLNERLRKDGLNGRPRGSRRRLECSYSRPN